jgi:predicted Zn-dependent protease
MKSGRLILHLLIGFALCSPTFAPAQEHTSSSPARTAKHSGHVRPKDNIEAIGTRNIGGRGFGNWYSLEGETKIGREYSHAIDQNERFEHDEFVTGYVNRVAQQLVRNSDAKVAFTINVIDSDEVSAFSLPGGFLYINTGLIVAAQDEAELAAVMAHEIAHVAAHHATRQLTRSRMFDFASMPLAFVGGPIGMALQDALKIVGPLSMNKFSRGFEAEADYLGVEYLYKAGYDPQALVSFFERLHAFEKRKKGLMSKAFSTHPQSADRIKKTQEEITKILPPRDMYVVSSSEFEEVKARLTAKTNSRRSDPGHPTLRRRPSADVPDLDR